jgi:hypothetical protein
MTRCSLFILVTVLAAAPARAQIGNAPASATTSQSVDEALLSLFAFQEGRAIVNALASQASTFPVGTSSGGFTYDYDQQSRAFVRRTSTFGPWFTERASTLGRRGAWSVGSAAQWMTFDRLDGVPLKDGIARQRFRTSDRTLIGSQAILQLSQTTLVVFGTYAASGSIDVGVTIPLVGTTITGSLQDADGRTVREGLFDRPVEIPPTSGHGLGDIQTRVKWNLARSRRVDGAVQLDFWLPTGDESSLASKQRTRQRFSGIVSLKTGSFEEHFNIGYTFRLMGLSPAEGWLNEFVTPSTATPNVLSYAMGSTWAAHERLTVVGEVVGRYVRDSLVLRASYFDPADGSVFVTEPTAGSINQVLGAVGAKLRVASRTIVGAHVLFSVTHSGLSLRPTAVLGVERAF